MLQAMRLTDMEVHSTPGTVATQEIDLPILDGAGFNWISSMSGILPPFKLR